jgi:hypothetical protein
MLVGQDGADIGPLIPDPVVFVLPGPRSTVDVAVVVNEDKVWTRLILSRG